MVCSESSLGLSTQTLPSESEAGRPPSSGRASSQTHGQDHGQDLGQPQGTRVFSPPVHLSPSAFLRLLSPLGIPVGSFSATLTLVKGPRVCLANTAFRTLSLQSRRTNRRVVREKLVLLELWPQFPVSPEAATPRSASRAWWGLRGDSLRALGSPQAPPAFHP